MLFLKYLEHSLDTSLWTIIQCLQLYLYNIPGLLYFCALFLCHIWSDGVFYNIGPTMDNVEYVNYYPVHLFSA